MAKQARETLPISCGDLEWLYIPDVVYASYGNCERRLQLIVPYRPHWETDQRWPCVLFLPGAAWHRQELYNSLPAYAKLAERGCVVAVVQVRESELDPFPAQIQDVTAALAFLTQKAEGFHIDPNAFFLAGNSSGGHIALLTGFTAAHGLYHPQGGPQPGIRGIIACSAPTDILLCAQAPLPPGVPETARPTAALLGVDSVQEHPSLARAASCAPYITKEIPLPPVLLFHGADDETVPPEHSRSLYRLLEEAGQPVAYYELTGCGHGGPAFWSDPVLDRMAQFLRQTAG